MEDKFKAKEPIPKETTTFLTAMELLDTKITTNLVELTLNTSTMDTDMDFTIKKVQMDINSMKIKIRASVAINRRNETG